MSETAYLSKIDYIIRFIVESRLYINKHTSFVIEHFVYLNLSILLLSNFIKYPYILLVLAVMLNIGSIILIDKYNTSSTRVDDGLETLRVIRKSSESGAVKSNLAHQKSAISVVIKDTGKMIISFSAIRILTILSFIGSLLLAVVPIITTIIAS